MPAPIGLEPAAPLAERVLLPGDPARALFLSQKLLDAPKMFNHYRGLWGYTGTAPDGAPLTIQSTGMGGPSAAIVISELADLGATTFLRIGTCGALDPTLGLGDLLIASEAIAADGTSRALGVADRVSATPDLVEALEETGEARSGTVATTDLFYDDRDEPERRWIAAGAMAVEMEAATLYALARKRGLKAAAILTVSDVILPSRVRITPRALRDGEQHMGEVAVRAVSAASEPAPEGA